MHVQPSVKSVRRQSVHIRLKEFENVSAFSNRTELKDMVVSQDGYALYLLALLGAATLSRTHRLDADFTALRLHLRSVFSVFAPGS